MRETGSRVMGHGSREQKKDEGLTRAPGSGLMTDVIWCVARQAKIDLSVCTVQSFRQPEKCNGCPLAPKGGNH